MRAWDRIAVISAIVVVAGAVIVALIGAPHQESEVVADVAPLTVSTPAAVETPSPSSSAAPGDGPRGPVSPPAPPAVPLGDDGAPTPPPARDGQ